MFLNVYKIKCATFFNWNNFIFRLLFLNNINRQSPSYLFITHEKLSETLNYRISHAFYKKSYFVTYSPVNISNCTFIVSPVLILSSINILALHSFVFFLSLLIHLQHCDFLFVYFPHLLLVHWGSLWHH